MGLGGGMDWALVGLAMVVFHILLSLFLTRMLVITLRLELEDLDHQIGQAIKTLIEGGLGDFEPPNPIQMALAELLTAKMRGEAPAEVVQVLRDESGKFSG